MTSDSSLEKSFRTRYWAAQHRHVASALIYRTALLLERSKRALERSKQFTQPTSETAAVSASRDQANEVRCPKAV